MGCAYSQQEADLIEAVQVVSPEIFPLVQFLLEVSSRKGEIVRAGKDCYNVLTNQITLPGFLTKNGEACTKSVPDCLIPYFVSNPSHGCSIM